MASGYVIQRRRAKLVKDIAAFIIDEIDREDLVSGDFLPSTRELIQKFNTNSQVVCDARKILVEQGFIKVVQNGVKVGTYVA